MDLSKVSQADLDRELSRRNKATSSLNGRAVKIIETAQERVGKLIDQINEAGGDVADNVQAFIGKSKRQAKPAGSKKSAKVPAVDGEKRVTAADQIQAVLSNAITKGKSPADIAAETGLSPSAVSQELNRLKVGTKNPRFFAPERGKWCNLSPAKDGEKAEKKAPKKSASKKSAKAAQVSAAVAASA